MLLVRFIRDASARLEALYPPQEAGNLVLRLVQGRLGVPSYLHITEPDTPIPEERLPGLLRDLELLAGGTPLQYVLGVADFCGRRFRVDPRVLIPRPETEELVAEAVRLVRARSGGTRVLDLCTGSGCIAWSLALDCPGTDALGVDLSKEALCVARQQEFAIPAGALRPRFAQADILDPSFDAAALSGWSGAELIVSNPPYIMDKERAAMHPNVLKHEPALALFVPDSDPLRFYRALARICASFLVPGGAFVLEFNEALGPETAAVLQEAGLLQVEVLRDIFGKNRFVRGFHS